MAHDIGLDAGSTANVGAAFLRFGAVAAMLVIRTSHGKDSEIYGEFVGLARLFLPLSVFSSAAVLPVWSVG